LQDIDNIGEILERWEDNTKPRSLFDDKTKESQKIRKIKFSPDSKFFAVCNDNSLVVYGKTGNELSYERFYKVISHPYKDNEKKENRLDNLTDFCFSYN